MEAFALALEEGSIAAAAGRLRISGPAAAKRIRQLEVLANAPLLIRGRRGVTATDLGARLYPIARDALAQRGRVVGALTGLLAADPTRIAGIHQLLGRAPAAPAEELFRDTGAVLAAIFHGAAEAMLVTRAQDGRIYEINEAAERLLGYRQEDLREQKIFEAELWEDARKRDEVVGAAIATRIAQRADLVLQARTGSRRLVVARFEAIELRDQVHVLVTIQDAPLAAGAAAVMVDSPGADSALDQHATARFLEALRRGECDVAESIVDDALDRGIETAAVHVQLIEPTMRSIGELWETNAISVADEHLATAISHKVASRAFWRAHRAPPAPRGRVLMAAVQGEHHVLGLRLAADVLELAGFEVLYLGADVPLEGLLDACRVHRPEVVGLAATMWLNVPIVLRTADELGRLEHPPRVMAGGGASGHAATQGLRAPVVARSDQVLDVVAQLLDSSQPTRAEL